MMDWIRTATLESYPEVARSVGLDPDRMLWRAGIKPSLLADPEGLIAGRAVAWLLQSSAVDADCPHFALLLAARRTVATLGPLSLLLQHEPTLGDVIQALVRYQNVLTETVSISMEDAGESMIVHLRIMVELDHDARQSIDLAMAALAHAFTAIGGDLWRPANLAAHRQLFGCPVEFDCLFNGFVCSAQALRQPNPGADPQMLHYARNYLELLRKPVEHVPLEERLRRSLHVRLPMGRATLDQVGADIGVHPRTLQRLLEKQGLSFAMVLGEARRELAIRYLQSWGRPLSSIAGLIGYGSASSFTRWFRTEFGVAPQAWRASARQAKGALAEAAR
jgi:AraC-like DNA-binding protein